VAAGYLLVVSTPLHEPPQQVHHGTHQVVSQSKQNATVKLIENSSKSLHFSWKLMNTQAHETKQYIIPL